VDVFGFEEQLVVTEPDGRTVVHSQVRWPEGGIVQAATYDPDDAYAHRPGEQSLYVITADPQAVWERCQTAGVEVVRPPQSPEYDPRAEAARDRGGRTRREAPPRCAVVGSSGGSVDQCSGRAQCRARGHHGIVAPVMSYPPCRLSL
jgi:uncharacterized glyoxalase superfamily protein PhnB